MSKKFDSNYFKKYKQHWIEYNQKEPCKFRVFHDNGNPLFFAVECLLDPFEDDSCYYLEIESCQGCSERKV